MASPWASTEGLGDGMVIPKMVEFKECEDFKDLRLPRRAESEKSMGKSMENEG